MVEKHSDTSKVSFSNDTKAFLREILRIFIFISIAAIFAAFALQTLLFVSTAILSVLGLYFAHLVVSLYRHKVCCAKLIKVQPLKKVLIS